MTNLNEIKEALSVEITARVRSYDSTLEAFEDTRARAGVPVDAKVRVLESNSINFGGMGQIVFVDAPKPVLLEFKWVDVV